MGWLTDELLDWEDDPVHSLIHNDVAWSKQISIACPEQHEGVLTDGSQFYLRLRYGSARLSVAPPGADVYEFIPGSGLTYEVAQ